MKASVTVTRTSGQQQFAARLEKLKKAEVLVGIPQDKSLRTTGEVTNAQLLFIHTNGSPLRNITARPVIQPAIKAPDNAKRISAELKQAAQSILEGDPDAAHQHLEKAGTLGANASKRWFTDPRNGWRGNAESTIEAKGSDKPLIDTGELRRDLTYVVKD
ncbi:MAG TPA: hypothetical protein VGM02_01525 [Acidobacteriaceae bacterium]